MQSIGRGLPVGLAVGQYGRLRPSAQMHSDDPLRCFPSLSFRAKAGTQSLPWAPGLRRCDRIFDMNFLNGSETLGILRLYGPIEPFSDQT